MQKVENLSHLKDLCIQILDKLNITIATYISDANKSVDVFANNVYQENVNNNLANSNYDHLVHSLTSVLKHSLQFSGHLNDNLLCNDNGKEPKATTTNLHKEEEKNYKNEQGTQDDFTTQYVSNSEETESIKRKQVQSLIAFPYERRDIKEYNVNQVLRGVVTSVNKESFCICPNEWKAKLLELISVENLSNLKQYDEAPPMNEVFGIFKLGEGLWRAIRTSDVYTNADQYIVYDAILLDFGENVTEFLKTHTFQLHEEIKQIPAQVIECFLRQDELLDDLKSKLYTPIELRVVENFGNGLLVEVIRDADDAMPEPDDIRNSDKLQSSKEENSSFETAVEQPQTKLSKSYWDALISTEDSSVETVLEQPQTKLSKSYWDELKTTEDSSVETVLEQPQTKMNKSDWDELKTTKDSSVETVLEQPQTKMNKSDWDELKTTKDSTVESVLEQPQMKLSEADWNMLNEEPLGTSNAIKAVYGYVPKDEKRICPFYNQNTGNCFKGSRCRLEHTLISPEGYTKDLLPTNVTAMDANAPLYYYNKNQQLLITPTYIMSLTHFYAHIGETPDQVFVWTKDDLPDNSGLDHIPHTLELVIARFEDNLYYRGQIIEQFNERMFKVFFIDYGNESIVDIDDMVSCVNEFNIVAPAQAVLCRIANVEACVCYTSEQYNCGKQFLQARIIDKSFVIAVVDHQHDDLVVQIIEPSLQNLPNEMITLGFLKPY